MILQGKWRSEVDGKTKPIAHFLHIAARPMRCLPFQAGLKACLNNEGQSLVETAVCLSVFFALTFGIILIGLALYSYNFVAESAREGARYAMTRGSSCTSPCTMATNASVQTYVKNLAFPGINPANLNANTTWPNSGVSCTPSVTPCNNPGNDVMVVVTYTFPWDIPFAPSGTLSMTSTSEITISQ